MHIRSLQTLVAISEFGSFAETAANQNMTLSTVSMQMKALEEELGVQIFDRAFRPPKLTPQGRRVAAEARRVTDAFNDLLEISQTQSGLVGDFKIGFVLTASVRLLPTFLSKAQVAYPKATFSVVTDLSDTLLTNVARGALDAAVVTAIDLPAEVGHYTICEEEMVFCLPAIASDWGLDRCMKELSFIHFMAHSGIGRLIADYLSRFDFHPKKSITLDSVEAVAECVQANVGFSILPKPDIDRLANRAIVVRSLAHPPLTRALALVFNQSSNIARSAKELTALFSAPLK